jgi:hypothetical protein
MVEEGEKDELLQVEAEFKYHTWLSVFTAQNSTPFKPPSIIRLIALPPPPPQPITLILASPMGFSPAL